MKKIFTLVAAALMSLSAMADTYRCGLAVDVYGTPSPYQQIDLTCDKNADGKYDILLKDFSFGGMPVGDITINNIDATTGGGLVHLTYDGTITLGGAWAVVGPLPTTFEGYIVDNQFIAGLKVPAVGVNVALSSSVTQIYGADFENWHKAGSSDEPNGWHGIKSGTGLASFAGASAFISDDVPAESTGSKSVKLQSGVTLGISANGTITTGRMAVGSMDPANSANNVFVNPNSTDVDGNGDPFYNTFNGHPTSISLWYKFKNGGDNTYPAMLSANIIGEGYFQEPAPAGTAYENLIANAASELKATDEWQKVTIPFTYNNEVDEEIDPASILVTINTCSVPGGGSKSSSNPDVLYIDDVELNYAPVPTSMTIFDKAVAGFSADNTTYNITLAEIPTDEDIDFECANGDNTFALIHYEEGNNTLVVNMYNEELKYVKTYTFNVTIDTTGINGVANSSNHAVTGRYSISGQKASKNAKGLVITRYADGSVIKSVK